MTGDDKKLEPEKQARQKKHRKEDSQENAEENEAGQREKTCEKEEAKESLEDCLLRLQADFDNFRKRTLREKNELYQRANEDIIAELLPVLDHVDLALKAAVEHEAPNAFIEGLRLVSEQMLSALRKFGLTALDAGACQEFDPMRHEALSHIASDEVGQNMVLAQVRRGYMLGTKLLRSAQVVVSSGPAAQQAANARERE